MITYKQVEAEMIKLVKAQPDFKYRDFRAKQLGVNESSHRISCAYLDDDNEGSCIWGLALVEAGIPVEDIKAHEGESISHVLELLNIDVSSDEEAFADTVQSCQDKNYSWESALEMALEMTGHEIV